MAHELIPFEPGFKVNPERRGPSWLIDREGFVYLRCRCGRVLGTISLHSIDEDGTVNASVLHDQSDSHPNGPCDWHTFVRLAEWIDGAMAARTLKLAALKLARSGLVDREAD